MYEREEKRREQNRGQNMKNNARRNISQNPWMKNNNRTENVIPFEMQRAGNNDTRYHVYVHTSTKITENGIAIHLLFASTLYAFFWIPGNHPTYVKWHQAILMIQNCNVNESKHIQSGSVNHLHTKRIMYLMTDYRRIRFMWQFGEFYGIIVALAKMLMAFAKTTRNSCVEWDGKDPSI